PLLLHLVLFPLPLPSTTDTHTLSLHDALPISRSPCGATPSSSMRSIASGMDAAEVFPDCSMSYDTGTCSGRCSCLTMADTIRALDRKSTRLNSSHSQISYAVFCLKKKKY